MRSTHRRPAPLRALGAFLFGALVFGGAGFAAYHYLYEGSLGTLVGDYREAEAYAREHIEVEVKEVRDPGGLWQTIPVVLSVYNSGPLDVVKLEVAATFRDEDDHVVREIEAAQALAVPSEQERVTVWKFIIGQTIGSDAKQANRVRTAEVRPLRAWTATPDDRAGEPLARTTPSR
jgi:hypothetical protein